MWLGCAGAFAIGARLTSGDRSWLFGGILAGALVNSAMALYQTLALPTSGTFGPYQGNQADGLLGNPVFLESLLLGAIALVAVRAAKCRLKTAAFIAWSACLVVMAVALEFSDERAAVGLLAVLLLALLAVYRWRGLFAGAPIALGYLVGYLGAGHSLGGRIAQGTSSVGFHQRLDLWRFAATAFLHRPIIGFGPNELEAATNPRMSLAFARTLQAGKIFSDAHDIVIEVAVTTGVLGLACFLAWVGGSIRGARNYFVYFALMCLAVEMVEPLNVAITPLAFLALGASLMGSEAGLRGDRPPPALGATARVAVAVLVSLSFLLGASMVAGDVFLLNAPPRQYSLSNSEAANSLLFYWPESSAALTQYYRYEAAVTHSRRGHVGYLERALTFSRETAERLPFDPLVWVSLGDSELALRRFHKAAADYLHALATDRWSAAALDGLGQTEMERHRFTAAERWYRREVAVLPPGPGLATAESHLHDAERGLVPQTGL